MATEMVSQFMHQPVVTVGPAASVEEVLALARAKGIHHIPIMERGKLLGLVCTCDLNAARPALAVLHVARRSVVTALPDCSAGDAARLMMTNAVGSVVICNRDGVWGIVTRSDLAQARPELAALLAEGRCAACGTSEHLRLGPGETFLCATCAEQANGSDLYDDGCGD